MTSRTLDELEGVDWGEPNFDSHLVQTCHRLRKKPIRDFTAEDLRIMIGQKISLRHLIPIALEMLEKDPLAEGDLYPGDLLNSILDAENELLRGNTLWMPRLSEIMNQASIRLKDEEFDDRLKFLKVKVSDFIERYARP